jgi:hypothetical protein
MSSPEGTQNNEASVEIQQGHDDSPNEALRESVAGWDPFGLVETPGHINGIDASLFGISGSIPPDAELIPEKTKNTQDITPDILETST